MIFEGMHNLEISIS